MSTLNIARRRCIPTRTPRPNSNFATVGAKTIIGNPPKIPVPLAEGSSSPDPESAHPLKSTSIFNKHILSSLDGKATTLPALIEQYTEHHGRVLPESLKYESRPAEERRVRFGGEAQRFGEERVVMVAHAVLGRNEYKITVCSGFALNVQSELGGSKDALRVVSCAHTFEEIRNSRLALDLLSSPFISTQRKFKSGSFIISGTPDAPIFHPVSAITSSLHRADVLVLSTSPPPPRSKYTLHALPVSPYPAQPGTAIRAHFVVDKKPEEEGWRPWIGGTWSKWVKGTVVGYTDFAGREAKPGTYDALSHLLFQPLPTPGSSGGPIVDEESGAVIGVTLGTRMDNRIAGVRGWGIPSETIFEMFSLPGLKLKNKI